VGLSAARKFGAFAPLQPPMRSIIRLAPLAAALAALSVAAPASAIGLLTGGDGAPAPGSPAYLQRDARNMADAYGRQTAPDGQRSPAYVEALTQESNAAYLEQLGQQLATPTRPAITPGAVFPGWNVGNPLRRGWDGTRGQRIAISYTNRYGALIRGSVFAPLPGARDPYTGEELRGPFPGVVITTGSVQGSERMYWWLAQDLAERGSVVMTYDVQGQGTSETFPHESEQVSALPFCNPFAEPRDIEQFGCPGVPAQQPANFVHGTEDALDFFLSTPDEPYHGTVNPLWALFDRSADRRTATPGRTTRIAIVGHSLGAAAVSYLQGADERVQTVVALDKLGLGYDGMPPVEPVVPALGIQSEYGFVVTPYWMSGGSSITPQPAPPNQAPDPRRELKTGFDRWRAAGIDTMVIVPRASTHLEYTDIPYALPASRYGQALSSVYVQAWLRRYLQHRGGIKPLLETSFRYLEPVAVGHWEPVTLDRAALLSYQYCSGYALPGAVDADVAGVGCD
jgi:hypothetical protein